MENELDLTLRLGLPVPTVRTQLSLHTPNTHQEINVAAGGRRVNNNNNNNNGGGEINLRPMFGMNENEGARINVNVDINLRVYNYVFQKFAGVGETLNFAPIRMPSPPAPAPVTPTGTDYVLIDVPSRRAHRNKSLAMENAPDANPNGNANAKRHRGPGGFCGGCGKADYWKFKCTNKNCNAINTPMWRRGPLGPKTLCNACGIKFRKEEERRAKRD